MVQATINLGYMVYHCCICSQLLTKRSLYCNDCSKYSHMEMRVSKMFLKPDNGLVSPSRAWFSTLHRCGYSPLSHPPQCCSLPLHLGRPQRPPAGLHLAPGVLHDPVTGLRPLTGLHLSQDSTPLWVLGKPSSSCMRSVLPAAFSRPIVQILA